MSRSLPPALCSSSDLISWASLFRGLTASDLWPLHSSLFRAWVLSTRGGRSHFMRHYRPRVGTSDEPQRWYRLRVGRLQQTRDLPIARPPLPRLAAAPPIQAIRFRRRAPCGGEEGRRRPRQTTGRARHPRPCQRDGRSEGKRRSISPNHRTASRIRRLGKCVCFRVHESSKFYPCVFGMSGWFACVSSDAAPFVQGKATDNGVGQCRAVAEPSVVLAGTSTIAFSLMATAGIHGLDVRTTFHSNPSTRAAPLLAPFQIFGRI